MLPRPKPVRTIQILLLSIACGLLVYGVFGRNNLVNKTKHTPSGPPPISPTGEAAPTVSVTQTTQPTRGPTPTKTPTNEDQTLLSFLYPGGHRETQSITSLSLTSSDGPEAITTWYKETIRKYSFQTKSFVQTNSNGNIANLLVARSARYEIRVNITKTPHDSLTKIAVALQTY
ncbi:hypothetical protein A2973_02280 [Candidatus Gottesmanbacteria bacterium RIFCSPLOWO2_01_FULL_49_10]|uniref:Uncharacterized protein n=1 Tax=Candidatus Gottesmanbacteria bacterium RIFCSPLOWO2_01_FULL_49_10 TaxID=1798396 RepID=A0A1F6B047_9BACT|nr:MAG: hypothetical protein A2973_02280 [Candidatus Gottesmanbacteria bacterium RIFCSPLOWO2_01_FULL_49_10]